VNRKILREVSEWCLEIAADGVRKNTCDVVSNEIACQLEQEYSITAYSPMRAPIKGRNHYVCLVPSSECNFCQQDGYIIVDATLKQFQDNISKEIEDYEIIPPCSHKREIYDEIEKP
jgi:hypothetical protein